MHRMDLMRAAVAASAVSSRYSRVFPMAWSIFVPRRQYGGSRGVV